VVDNLPVIPEAKVAKLRSALVKIYSQASAALKDTDIYMPFDKEAEATCGFCFITFKTAEDAKLAIALTQGYKLDAKHNFRVSPYSDLEKYHKLPDVYVQPEAPPFKPRPDPTCYLVDSHCRDQFVTRYGSNTDVAWANLTGEEPSLVYGGEREKQDGKVWCDSYVFWSPQGTYLATFHKQGIKLWGGKNFEAQGKFAHHGVEVLDFSPCERYLITYRYSQDVQYDPTKAIIVWDVRTGAELRSYELKNPLDPKYQVQATIWVGDDAKRTQRLVRGRVVSYDWNDAKGVGEFTLEEGHTIHKEITHDSDHKVTPMMEPNRLKWSPDGSYVARLGCDIITVYDVPSMTILDKKSLAAKDVLEFVWCPSASRNVLSYWSPAVGNHPALISVVSLPDRTEVCSRKLFDVMDGKMVWQNDGDYLCVHMTKIVGKKRSQVLM
jgi:translation initiation factor 3 subunit B